MKSAGKARNNGLYRHIRTSKEIIRNLLNDLYNNSNNVATEGTHGEKVLLLLDFFKGEIIPTQVLGFDLGL